MQIAVVVNPTSGKRRGGQRLGPLPLTAEAVPRALTMFAGQP